MNFTLIAAPFTPMKNNGKLDLSKIGPYAEFLSKNGVDGAFVCGSTGEGPSLSLEERKSVFQAWAESRPEGFRLIAHVGDTTIPSAIELSTQIESLGYDAFSTVAPYYYRPKNEEHLVDILSEVAAAAPGIPFYYYHIPILTRVEMSMPDFWTLAETKIPNFGGLKYTFWNMMDFNRCLQMAKEKHEIFWGRDEVLLGAVALGARGAVGSTYNYMAPLYRKMFDFLEEGKIDEAQTIQEIAISCIYFLDKYGGMGVGKAIMRIIGLDLGECRSPIENVPVHLLPELEKDLADQNFFDFCHVI